MRLFEKKSASLVRSALLTVTGFAILNHICPSIILAQANTHPADTAPPAPAQAVAAPTPATGTCKTALTPLPTGTAVTSETPTALYEGSIRPLEIVGKALDPSWKVLLCPKTTAKDTQPSVGAIDIANSSATQLEATISAPPKTAGTYATYFSDASGKVYDSGQTFVINSSTDKKYLACAAPGGTVPANPNLQCSFSPYPYKMAYDSFGKGVANSFVAVYVVVQNKNENLEYLLQDVRGGFSQYVVSSYDKAVPQDVSVKAEQFSARAVLFRVTAWTASVLTGVAGFAGNAILQDAANIFAGPGQTGLQAAIPNLSTAELTNLDSLGFSVTSTVIPKGGAIKVVAFIPSDILEPSNLVGLSDADKKAYEKKHHLRHPNSYSTYKGDALNKLLTSMTIEVSGTHVQEVANPAP